MFIIVCFMFCLFGLFFIKEERLLVLLLFLLVFILGIFDEMDVLEGVLLFEFRLMENLFVFEVFVEVVKVMVLYVLLVV